MYNMILRETLITQKVGSTITQMKEGSSFTHKAYSLINLAKSDHPAKSYYTNKILWPKDKQTNECTGEQTNRQANQHKTDQHKTMMAIPFLAKIEE